MTNQAETRKRAAEKAAQRKRQGQMRLLIIVGIVALAFAALLITVTLSGGGSQAAEFEGLTQTVDESGISVGFAIGEPEAPVTVLDFSDFSCSHCFDLSDSIEQIIADYVTTGDVRVVYKPVTFVYPQYSAPAGAAAYCAAQQGQFWEMHTQIWDVYGRSGPQGFTEVRLTERAGELGLDTAAFAGCFNDAATAEALNQVLTEAQQRGVQGTPTVFVNDVAVTFTASESRYTSISRAIDQALAATGG